MFFVRLQRRVDVSQGWRSNVSIFKKGKRTRSENSSPMNLTLMPDKILTILMEAPKEWMVLTW